MHLILYQQSLLGDDMDPAGLGAATAGLEGNWPLGGAPQGQGDSAPRGQGDSEPASPEIRPAGVPPQQPEQQTPAESVAALWARCEDLRWRLESNALQEENKVLEAQVAQMQKDFRLLQNDVNDMKERSQDRLLALERALQARQELALSSEQRAVCKEDLTRFHTEQQKAMAGHWKDQCVLRDERIKELNLELSEYTVWQSLHRSTQTEASLSHQLHCLQERHEELQVERRGQESCHSLLAAEVAEAREELSAWRSAEGRGELRQQELAERRAESRCRCLEADAARLSGRLRLLEAARRRREEPRASAAAERPSQHSCIWRDELVVRQEQLEKITVQLDRTNNALHAAQAVLSSQQARHEELKTGYAEAEERLRRGEKQRALWKGRVADLRRVEEGLRRFSLPGGAAPLSGVPPRPAVQRRGSRTSLQ